MSTARRTYTLTYDCVTPESAEHGDFRDCGLGRSPRDGTSTRELSATVGNPGDSPEARAAWDAAHDAATEAIEPDEYDIAEATELLAPDYATTPEAIESAAAVVLMAGILRREYGATEPSCSPSWQTGCWYTTPDGSEDYTTGEVTRVSVHLDGWTEEEQRAIYDAVTGRSRK